MTDNKIKPEIKTYALIVAKRQHCFIQEPFIGVYNALLFLHVALLLEKKWDFSGYRNVFFC